MLKKLDRINLPNTAMAQETRELLKKYGDELLWNHCHRVFFFGAVKSLQDDRCVNLELLYVAALFHDMGLTKKYSSECDRFEIDGANAARAFLNQYQIDKSDIDQVWDAISLHTTIGIPEHKDNVIRALYYGVGMDVMGDNFAEFSPEIRDLILKDYPKSIDFKNDIIKEFYNGFKNRPASTFGTVNADISKRLDDDYKGFNFYDTIINSPWEK